MQVEIKVKIKETEKIKEKILSLGAKFWKKTQEKDIYFSSKKGTLKLTFTSENECLMIHDYREAEGTSEVRVELPLDAVYAEKIQNMLEDSVGIKLKHKKGRQQYLFHGVLISIDEIVGADTFLELVSDEVAKKELPNQKSKLLEILTRLGFSEKDLEQKSYVDLYLA